MKVLWIVNTIFPYPAEKIGAEKTAFGGWLNGLANELKNIKDIKLAIATVYNGNQILEFDDGKITYYLIPGAPALKYNKKMEEYWKKVSEKFNPDLVHIHGSEYSHGLAFVNACPNIKSIVSIQGLVSAYAEVYMAGISSKDIIKNITFRDIIRKENIFQQRKKFIYRGTNEIKLIEKVDNIIGRTDWDRYNSNAINSKAKYYCLQETVRSEFYKNEWNIKNIERNSLYLSQAQYPIKGLHVLLRAINIVKRTYPDVKLYISGNNILKDNSFISRIKLSGYGKYIKNLIKKYQLQDNVIFTGILSEKEVIQRLLKTHIVIVPSIIENESNSLTEAHLLSIPTIASFTGGMTDRIIHKETGFLYPFTEYSMCAGYIMEYFSNDEVAVKYGKAARDIALVRNNPEQNKKRIIEIYTNIMGKEND